MAGQDCILITGGAGFIGCRLSSLLQSFDLPIVAIDNLHPQVHPKQIRPELLPDFVNLLVMDVCDDDAWKQALSKWKPRILVHLAAETGTGQSLTESSRHAMVNVVGTTKMLDAFLAASCLPDHVLLSSSRAVYGEGAWRDADGEICYPGIRTAQALEAGQWNFTDQRAREMSPLPHRAGVTAPNPTSVYGATKLAQEHVLGAWCSAMGVPLSILRFQNVYGPGQSPFNAYTGIINLFYRQAYSKASINVYEDGAIGRDFIFIDDVARACKAALDRPPRTNRLLDVGTGQPTTILDAALKIAELNKAPEPTISGRFRPGDVRWAVAETGDLEQQLGVSASISFEEGIQLVGDWLVSKGYV